MEEKKEEEEDPLEGAIEALDQLKIGEDDKGRVALDKDILLELLQQYQKASNSQFVRIFLLVSFLMDNRLDETMVPDVFNLAFIKCRVASHRDGLVNTVDDAWKYQQSDYMRYLSIRSLMLEFTDYFYFAYFNYVQHVWEDYDWNLRLTNKLSWEKRERLIIKNYIFKFFRNRGYPDDYYSTLRIKVEKLRKKLESLALSGKRIEIRKLMHYIKKLGALEDWTVDIIIYCYGQMNTEFGEIIKNIVKMN